MFNDGGFREKIRSGELGAWVRRDTHPSRTEAAEPFCTRTQEVSYLDERNNEVARVHQYVRRMERSARAAFLIRSGCSSEEFLYRLQKNPTRNR